jgi:calcineurin-like phosphoesterase
MTGPSNCAIGANYDEVYKRMRFGGHHRFKVGNTKAQFNAVIVKLYKENNKISKVYFMNK